MHKNTSKKGFTLVEIMIVVVIIGLLAAMAIPAFRKIRESSRSSAMDNDARQLAAAQPYMLENSLSTVTASIINLTGAVGTPLDAYVSQVGKGYTSTSVTITANGTFSLAHPQVATGSSTYSAEGQKQ